MSEDTALTRQASGNVPALQQDRPDFLPKAAPRGLETASQTDLIIPRLGVCQALSPQKKKGNSAFIEKLEEGQLFNTVSQEIYGKEVLVAPLFFFKRRIYFRDMNEGGGILCQSRNGVNGGQLSPKSCEACAHSKFNEEGKSKAPDCSELYNFACILGGSRELIVATLKGAGIKQAKQWNSIMRLRNADTFAGVYKLESIERQSNNQSWHELKVTPAGWVPKDVYEFCEGVYNSLRGKEIVVDQTGEGTEPQQDDEIPF